MVLQTDGTLTLNDSIVNERVGRYDWTGQVCRDAGEFMQNYLQ